MKGLARIEAVYAKLDAVLERERSGADEAGLARLEAEQTLNDQAYFLLCWGQLEAEIDDTCRDAARRRRSDADWRVRRAWDLYNPDDKRFSGLSFENRARLVLDGQAGRGSPYARTIKYYGIRNEIAHGKLSATRVDVGAFVQDCSVIRAALHRAA